MFLETTDAVAILGYAGLGATARGTEPADWMSAVLRGRNFPLERSLDELAGALRRQFPKHLQRLPKGVHAAHSILVPAFVGAEVRLYTIDMALTPDRKTCSFRFTRHIVGEFGPRPSRTPRLGLAGSGATYLARDRYWVRNLLRLVRASDRQQVSPHAVADHLAGLNHRTHLDTTDGTVGPRCVVAWRHSKLGVYSGGGGHQFYDGLIRAQDSATLPTIGNGMDIQSLVQAIMPRMLEQLAGMRDGQPPKEIDTAALNAELAKLPDEPDEDLK